MKRAKKKTYIAEQFDTLRLHVAVHFQLLLVACDRLTDNISAFAFLAFFVVLLRK
jgi:hypothetical protein